MAYRFACVLLSVNLLAACQFEALKTESGPDDTTGPATGSQGGGGATTSGSSSTGITPLDGEWVAAMPDLSEYEWECGPFSYLSVHPTEDTLIAGVNERGLWASRDQGDNWKRMGRGDGSDVIAHRTSALLFDPKDSDIFYESGTYGFEDAYVGVYKTEDGGDTFEQIGDIAHIDDIGVDFTDPDRQTMLAPVHESQVLYKSDDGGKTWSDIADKLPKVKVCAYALVLDADTYLLGCAGIFGEGDPAIVRTDDGGDSWTIVYEGGGAAPPLVASDGSIYWTRIARQGVVRSTDDGETWEELPGDGMLELVPLRELSDGRIAAATEQAIVAFDGDEWEAVSPALPYLPNGFAYSPFSESFYVWYFTCNAEAIPAPDDAIMRFSVDD